MKRRIISLALCMAMALSMCLLPIPVQASLTDPTQYDVVIATTPESGYEPRFPDVVLIPQKQLPAEDQAAYPEGKLLVAYYKNTDHVTADNPNEIKSSSFQIVESKDSGKTWSEPVTVIDQAQMLAWGISTEERPAEARDPNFFLLSDGTVILTFFTTMPSSITSDHAVYIVMSSDGGKTWNTLEKPMEVEHEFEGYCAKRGDITQFANGDILVPVYSGSTAYGILYSYDSATHKLTKKGEAEVRASNEPSRSSAINEVSFCATLDEEKPGTVYAFARQPGFIYVSEDYGMTWTYIESADTAIHQPGLKLLPDGTIFATWSRTNSPRPIYGKIYDPKQGWDATEEKLIYKYTGGGASDMADPSGVLLADGKTLLTVWYLTAEKAICGTFATIDEMASPFELEATNKVVAGYDVQLKYSGTKASQAQWTSSDETVATVSSTGLVSGLKVGMVTITATIPDTDIVRTCKVSVLPGSGVYEDFEGEAMVEGSMPAGWNADNSTSSNYIKVAKDGENKVLYFVKAAKASGTLHGYYTFAKTDTAIVSLRYKAEALTNSHGIGFCNGGYNPQHNGTVFLRVWSDGALKYYNGSEYKDTGISGITTGQWYDVKIEVTAGDSTAKVTFGTQTVDVPLIGNRTSIDRVVLAGHGSNNNNDKFYVDDVRLVTNVPAFYVSSDDVELSLSNDTGTSFAGTASYKTTSVSLNVETSDLNAVVTLDGETYTGEPIDLQVGENVITLSVLSGGVTTDYTVTITQEAPPYDKTELTALVDSVKALKGEIYTADSWAVVEKALAEAEAILADADVRQSDVDAAEQALDAAVAALSLRDDLDAKIGQNFYVTLQEALAAAADGDVITLLRDADVDHLLLTGAVTFDLNGNTLTAPDAVITFAGQIIDSSDGKGAVITAEEKMILPENNRQLPLYDSTLGGYRFYDYSFDVLGVRADATTSDPVFGFRLKLSNTEGYALMANADSGLGIRVKLTWEGMTSTAPEFAFGSDLIATYAENMERISFYALMVRVSGAEGKNLTLEAIARTDSRVEAIAAPYSYSVPVAE